MIKFIKRIVIPLLCLGLGVWAGQLMVTDTQEVSNEPTERKPLYWVAPMDDSYRRDKPGKSPMGMDLVPVYADEQGADTQVGTVSINPSVVNTLGVRTAKAQVRPIVHQIQTVGYIEYNQDTMYHVHPRVSGWVDKLYVKSVGEAVKKGDALYQLYSPELVNAQEEYLIALERTNQSLIQATESRLRALLLSERVIEQLKRTRKVMQQVTFYAPQSGIVDNLGIREGFYVKPGNNLMSIAALDQIWVNVEVFAEQAKLIRPKMAVTMTLDYLPARKWHGEVDFIYPTLDATTRAVNVRLRFGNAEGLLKPNMFANVSIHATQAPKLSIPREALIQTGNQERVVVALGEGQFKSVEVYTGQKGRDYVEIVAGIQEGELVATSAQFMLDSESSKSSDFKRMYHGEAPIASIAKTTGLVNQIDIARRQLNISRGPIEKWGRPPATLDFAIADNINLEQLQPGMSIEFVFEASNGEFTVLYIKPVRSSVSAASGEAQ